MKAYVIVKYEPETELHWIVGIFTDLQVAKNMMLRIYSELYEDGWTVKMYSDTELSCKNRHAVWHFDLMEAPFNQIKNYK